MRPFFLPQICLIHFNNASNSNALEICLIKDMYQDNNFFAHDLFDFYATERCQKASTSVFYYLIVVHFKVRCFTPHLA